jgi:hypothetical protein
VTHLWEWKDSWKKLPLFYSHLPLPESLLQLLQLFQLLVLQAQLPKLVLSRDFAVLLPTEPQVILLVPLWLPTCVSLLKFPVNHTTLVARSSNSFAIKRPQLPRLRKLKRLAPLMINAVLLNAVASDSLRWELLQQVSQPLLEVTILPDVTASIGLRLDNNSGTDTLHALQTTIWIMTSLFQLNAWKLQISRSLILFLWQLLKHLKVI